jgi:hypothetical protein
MRIAHLSKTIRSITPLAPRELLTAPETTRKITPLQLLVAMVNTFQVVKEISRQTLTALRDRIESDPLGTSTSFDEINRHIAKMRGDRAISSPDFYVGVAIITRLYFPHDLTEIRV